MWKGGTSDLNHYLRKQLVDWKIKSLKKYDYKCFITGKNGTFEIHHIKPFNLIRDELLVKFNVPVYRTMGEYDPFVLGMLTEQFLKEHDRFPGIPLLPEIHNLFHHMYGWDEEVTMDNLLEFKQLYLDGKLNALSKEMEGVQCVG